MADSFKIFGIVVRKQEVIDKSQDPPAREIAEIGVNKQSVRLLARHIQEVDGEKVVVSKLLQRRNGGRSSFKGPESVTK